MIHRSLRILVGLTVVLALLAGNRPPAYADDEPLIVTTYPSITGKRIYIVEQGDTLWDISEEFFDDPHFWPTLWAFNAQITNPHWIYPGDFVILFPRSLVEKGGVLVWSQSRYTEKPKDIILEARSKGFLSDRKFKESGKIVYSREERGILGQYDEVYVEFYIPKKIRRGEEFTVYRPGKAVRHPITGKVIGHKVRHLGVAKVLGVEKKYVRALLLTTYEEIQRGDMLTDIFTHQFRVSPKPNKVDLEARILHPFEDVEFLGENHYVFIDKGRTDGIEAGNRLVVLEKGDGQDLNVQPYEKRIRTKPGPTWDFSEGGEDVPTAGRRKTVDRGDQEDLPWETVGEIMVIEPYDSTSLGVITRSIKELYVGQRCEMRRNYGAAPDSKSTASDD